MSFSSRLSSTNHTFHSSTALSFGRKVGLALVLGLGLACAGGWTAQAQDANTFVVNSLADNPDEQGGDDSASDGACDTGLTVDGEPECTLRAALDEAETSSAVDTVRFDDVPVGGALGGDYAIIVVTEENDELLVGGIEGGVYIDGTTAPGYPSDLGGPIVGIDATNLPEGVDQGLDLDSDGNGKIRVEGISVFGAADDGIDDRGGSPTEIIDCWIGIEPDGTVTPNGRNPGSFELGGLSLRRDETVARGNVIAGPNCANADSGTLCTGILSEGHDHTIKGNIIGVDHEGNSFSDPVSDNGAGIIANEGQIVVGYGHGETIPDDPSPLDGGEGNLITENTGDGVALVYTRRDSVQMGVRGNRIFANGGEGINIDPNRDETGLTPYDGNDEGDTDEGVNRSQNYPVDVSTSNCDDSGAETSVEISYRVRSDADSASASNYGENGLKVDFYVTESGETQGKTYVGTDPYAASDAGDLVTATLTTDKAACSDEIVATATDADNNTSQFTPSTTALPVELASMDGSQTETGAIQLTWTTASEQNNAGFEVQQATEDESWKAISFVEGHGTVTERTTYSYKIEDLAAGTHTFRLKQVDLDGTTTLHEPVTVNVGMAEALQLTAPSPNPVSQAATASFAVKEARETSLKLYNVLGQEVATLYKGTPEAGESRTVRVERETVSALSSGVYFLRLQVGDKVETQRFTVMR